MKTGIGFLIPFFVILIIGYNSCSLFEDSEADPELEVELYSNPSDPTICKVTDQNGDYIIFYGQKDEEGIPISIHSAVVTNPDGTTTIYYDSLNRVSAVLAPQGTSFDYEWISDEKFRIIINSTEGEFQFNIPVDLSDTAESSSFKKTDQHLNEIIVRGFKEVPQIEINQIIPGFSPLHFKSTEGLHFIQITKCGEPVNNARISWEIMPPIGNFNFCVMEFYENGIYRIEVPSVETKPTNIDFLCNNFLLIFDKTCANVFIKQLGTEFEACAKLGVMIESGSIPPEKAEKLKKDCQAMALAIKTACDIIKSNPAQYKDFCKKYYIVENIPVQEYQYFYRLKVNVPGEKPYNTVMVEFDPNNPQQWTYEMPSEVSIKDFKTIPGDPQPFQGYTIYAFVVCPNPEGTDVTISISGDDGYSNSQTVTITESSEVTLFVPGAKESVVDKIKVSIGEKVWTTWIRF